MDLCNKAADKAGDGINALGTYVQGLTKQGQEQLNKYFQVQIYILGTLSQKCSIFT